MNEEDLTELHYDFDGVFLMAADAQCSLFALCYRGFPEGMFETHGVSNKLEIE